MTEQPGNGAERQRKPALDDIDMLILDRFRQDAEYPIPRMADEIGLSQNGIRGRINRLKSSGVLSLVAVIDYDRVSSRAIEAYVEVMFPGDANVHDLLWDLMDGLNRREIRDAITLIGDVDALIRVRVQDIAALRDLVTDIRASPNVVGTRTRIVAGNWWYGVKRDKARKRVLAESRSSHLGVGRHA